MPDDVGPGVSRCGECDAYFFSKWGHRKGCSRYPAAGPAGGEP